MLIQGTLDQKPAENFAETHYNNPSKINNTDKH